MDQAIQWGQNASTTSGLVYGYRGGVSLNAVGNFVTIADGTILLANNVTNYVERSYTGVVSATSTGWTASKVPMAAVVTANGAIQSVDDWRGSVGPLPYFAPQSGEVGVKDIRFPPGHILRYGGMGDGNAANAAANSDAIENMIASAIPGTGTPFDATTFARWPTRFSRGVFKIARAIVVPECVGFVLLGEGTHGSQALSAIQWAGSDAPNGWMLDIQSVFGFVLRDVSLIGVADINAAATANRIGNGIRAGRMGAGHWFASWMEWRNVSASYFTGTGIELGRYAGWSGTAYPADVGQADNSTFRDVFAWNCRVGLVINSINFIQCVFDGLRVGSYGGNPVDVSGAPVESAAAAPIRFRTKTAVRILYGQLVADGAALYAPFDDGSPEAQYATYALDGSFQILSGYTESRYLAYVANGANSQGGTTAIGPNVIQNFHLFPGEAGGVINAAKYPIYYAQTKVPLRLENCDNIWVKEAVGSAGVTAVGCRVETPYVATTDPTLGTRNNKSAEINCAVLSASGAVEYKAGTQLGGGLGVASETHDEFMFATNLVARIESGATTYQFQARASGNSTARGIIVDSNGLSFFNASGLVNGATYTRAQLGGIVFKVGTDGAIVRYAAAVTVQSAGALNVTEAHDSLLGDATAGVVYFVLPFAGGLRGRSFTFIKKDSSTNNVVVEPPAGNTINGAASLTLGSQWKSRTLQSDGGSTWMIVGAYL